MPSYTYAIGDIHGELDLLRKIHNKILAHTMGADDYRIIFLGDYVDRGAHSNEVVKYLRELAKDSRYEFLKGNHEDMMVNVDDYWIPNGGDTTIESYKLEGPDWEQTMTQDAEWMHNLPTVFWDDHRVYVHAAVDENRPLEDQNPTYNMWTRYHKGDDYPVHGRHVVHGHTPLNVPFLGKNRTNLDTGAVVSGVLTCGVFQDDLPGGPVEIIQAFRS